MESPLVLQEASPISYIPSSSFSASRARILVSAETLRKRKIPAGEPVIVKHYEAERSDAQQNGDHNGTEAKSSTLLWAVGVAWPSFALEPEVIQLPPVLLSGTGLAGGDKVLLAAAVQNDSTMHTKPRVAAEIKLRVRGTALFKDVDLSGRLNGSSAQPVPFSAINKTLLAAFAKEILLDLGFIHVEQSFELVFQGVTYQLSLASVRDVQGIPGVSTSPFSAKSIFAVSRGSVISIIGKSRGANVPNDIIAAKRTENSDGPLTHSTKKAQDSGAAYDAIGGLDKQIEDIRALVEMPLTKPEIFKQYGLKPPKGVLLFGPPGTGKTSLARAVAASTRSSVLTINGPELSSAYHGETEQRLRDAFAEARRRSPCIVVIDEVDALVPRRDSGAGEGASEGAGEVERRVVATLLTLLDGMSSDEPVQEAEEGADDDDEEDDSDSDASVNATRPSKQRGPPRVVVIAATNRPNAIDPALRRPGRLDREIEIGIPTAHARLSILKILLKDVPHSLTSEQIEEVAACTHGYVGADLSALVREAGMLAIRRAFDDLRRSIGEVSEEVDLSVRLSSMSVGPSQNHRLASMATLAQAHLVSPPDFVQARALVRPSAMREVYLETPPVRWSDIAGGDSGSATQQRVREAVEWPLRHADVFRRLGVSPPRGILLYGPPGCSKTLTARALATESGLNFIAVKGPELFSKYVGESERAVREVFRKARAAAPSIIFFDELDALTATRGSDGADGNGPTDRVIASLLNEMDGVEALSNVVVVAATNRPEIIDPALLRPGRLDRLLYVGPPDRAARRQILSLHTSRMTVDDTINLDVLADLTHGCSGAEVVSVCQDAGLLAMNENINVPAVKQQHFEQAAKAVRRRITTDMIASYERWRDQIAM